jgi:hypothetical protein
MTDSMIERVGNVIAARLTIAIATGNLSMQDIARAAIEAMRNPTDAMEDVGNAMDGEVGALTTWQSMIDAALNEKAGT